MRLAFLLPWVSVVCALWSLGVVLLTSSSSLASYQYARYVPGFLFGIINSFKATGCCRRSVPQGGALDAGPEPFQVFQATVLHQYPAVTLELLRATREVNVREHSFQPTQGNWDLIALDTPANTARSYAAFVRFEVSVRRGIGFLRYAGVPCSLAHSRMSIADVLVGMFLDFSRRKRPPESLKTAPKGCGPCNAADVRQRP